jgi:hypothetical protein
MNSLDDIFPSDLSKIQFNCVINNIFLINKSFRYSMRRERALPMTFNLIGYQQVSPDMNSLFYDENGI